MPEVSCPSCGQTVLWQPSSKFRPFCSQRCRTLDLGAWASERYVVPGGKEEPDSGMAEGHSDGPGGDGAGD
jgi:uncharacterized protein